MLARAAGRGASDAFFAFCRRTTRVWTLLWSLGHVLGLLACTDTLDTRFAYAGLLTLPHVARFFLLANAPLMWRVLKNFEWIYLAGLTLTWAVLSADAFKGDARCCWVAALAASLLMCFSTDANPALAGKFDRVFGTLFGAIVTGLTAALAMFGFFPDMAPHRVKIGETNSAMGALWFNTVFFANQRMAVICVFFLKNFFFAFRYPNCLVILKGRIRADKISERAYSRDLEAQSRDFAILSSCPGASVMKTFKTRRRATDSFKESARREHAALDAAVDAAAERSPAAAALHRQLKLPNSAAALTSTSTTTQQPQHETTPQQPQRKADAKVHPHNIIN